MKDLSILKKFSLITLIVTISVSIVAYLILSVQRANLEESVIDNTVKNLTKSAKVELDNKFNVGISNAVSIESNDMIVKALQTNNRELAIVALNQLSENMKKRTPFQNIKVHVHTKDNKSFLRNWKTDKYGDDLSSFRNSIVKVNSTLESVNTFEVGKAGLSIRSVVPIISNDGVHMGSLEFIQGINSVAKAFANKDENFILLMDKNLAVADVSKLKKLDKYIVSQKTLDEDFYADAQKINYKELLTNKYFTSDKYFYTYVDVIEFDGKKLGIALLGKKLIDVNHAVEDATKIIVQSLIMIIIALVLLMIFSLINLKQNVINPVLALKETIDGLLLNKNSSQNNRIQIKSKDEIGDIVNSFNKYLDFLEEGVAKDASVINETRKIIEKVNNGLLNDRVNANAHSEPVNMLVEEVNDMISVLQKNMLTLSDILVNLSNAKYDYKMPDIKLTGLLASIFSGTKVTQSTINEVMCLIDASNNKLIDSAAQLASASSKLSTSSNTQAASLEETAAAIEEISATIEQSAQNASKMATYAHNVTQSNIEGKQLAGQTSRAMDELGEQVNSINEAITVIDQIAFQTNILSLNAAVEAATAGEAGKGFAVVAAEVRNLANRSAEAAKEIKDLVENANIKASTGKDIANEMTKGYEKLDSNIEATIKLIENVAAASKEQQAAMEQITDTVNSLDQATQQNASLANSISDMSNLTSELSHQLQNAINSTSFDKNAVDRICHEEMIFEANKLKSDHIEFKNNNFSQCKGGHQFTVKNHHECNLGKWIDRYSSTSMGQTQSWAELKESHKDVHEYVQKTVDLYAKNAENKEILEVTHHIEDSINNVFDLMNKVREENCKIDK